MKSALQKEAVRQALSMQNKLSQHRQLMHSGSSRPGYTSNQSPNWHISHETLSGDFALDEVLAQDFASRVVSNDPVTDWLRAYRDDKTFDPNADFMGNLGDVILGRDNLPGNLNAERQAIEAAMAKSKITRATAKIAAGTAEKVKIHSHMTLYNGNTSGGGRPRLRAKVTKLPIKVFSSMLSEEGAGYRVMSKGGLSARAKDVKSMQNLAGSASNMKFLNGKLGGGILTFAPTVAFDLIDSIHRDTNRNWHWNALKFSNAEIRNQPGNAVGFAASLATELIAVGLFSAAAFSAPVILCALGVGIIAQIVWNHYHMPDKTDNLRRELIGS